MISLEELERWQREHPGEMFVVHYAGARFITEPLFPGATKSVPLDRPTSSTHPRRRVWRRAA